MGYGYFNYHQVEDPEHTGRHTSLDAVGSNPVSGSIIPFKPRRSEALARVILVDGVGLGACRSFDVTRPSDRAGEPLRSGFARSSAPRS
jgi:hypothetical protein